MFGRRYESYTGIPTEEDSTQVPPRHPAHRHGNHKLIIKFPKIFQPLDYIGQDGTAF